MINWEKHFGDGVGWDPEIFAVKANGEMLPAFEFLPSKEDPFQIQRGFYLLKGYASQKAYWDGFQAEFTTMPLVCLSYAIDELHAGLKAILQQARRKEPSARLTLKNVFEMTADQLFAATPEQVALGCDPSFNAYGTDPFYQDNPFELPYRMAGGHIHLGVGKFADEKAAIPTVKMLDLLVGVPAVALFADIDNPVRRRYYGRAGEFRLPPHGLEYRTLSNAWLGHPAMANLVTDMARKAVVASKQKPQFGVSEERVKSIIDNTDVLGARELVKEYKDIWIDMLAACYGNDHPKHFFKMIEGGAQAGFPDYSDIENNWSLSDDTWVAHSNEEHQGTYGSFAWES